MTVNKYQGKLCFQLILCKSMKAQVLQFMEHTHHTQTSVKAEKVHFTPTVCRVMDHLCDKCPELVVHQPCIVQWKLERQVDKPGGGRWLLQAFLPLPLLLTATENRVQTKRHDELPLKKLASGRVKTSDRCALIRKHGVILSAN